jgi:RNA polymerase sigma-70 factor, ECF subfamily
VRIQAHRADAVAIPAPPPVQSLSDEEVVRRVLTGDSDLFEVIMRRYNQRLYRTLRSSVSDGAEAEDIMQETYTRAFENLAQFEGRSRFSTWLMRIAIHELLARRRRGGRFTTLEPQPERAAATTPEDAASSSQIRGILERAIAGIPTTLRVVYVLRDVDGLGTDETADCLGITPVNVRVRLHRARTHLRARFDGQAIGDVRQLHPFAADRCNRVVAGVLRRIREEGRHMEA